MFYKTLYNVDHPFHLKLPHFTNPICITCYTYSPDNDKDPLLAIYNANQFSRCFVYSAVLLWNSLPNEAVLTLKQDRFKASARKF